MKTVQEAVAGVMLKVRPEEIPAAQEKSHGIFERYKSILHEVMAQEETQVFLTMMAEEGECCTKHLKESLATALVNGVIIGIEMEKQDA